MLLSICILFEGCTKKELSPSDYMHWIEDSSNGLKQVQEMGGYEFTAQFRPSEFQALQELRDSIPDKTLLEKTTGNYKNTYYFIFKMATEDHDKDILKAGISSPNEYYGRLQYFISGLQNDFKLAAGKDTLACSLCNFERTYSVSPYSNFVLAFDRPKNDTGTKDLVLYYQDRVFGGGRLSFRFDKKDLDHIPQIQLPQ
jgi:hypothetical protein